MMIPLRLGLLWMTVILLLSTTRALEEEDCESQLHVQLSLNNECNSNLMQVNHQHELCEHELEGIQMNQTTHTPAVPDCDDQLTQERKYSLQCLDQLKAEEENRTQCQEQTKEWQDKYQQQRDQQNDVQIELDHCETQLGQQSNSTDACQSLLKEMQTQTDNCNANLELLTQQQDAEKEAHQVCVNDLTGCTTTHQECQEILQETETHKTDCDDKLWQEKEHHNLCQQQHGEALNQTQEWQQQYYLEAELKLETQQHLDLCQANLTQEKEECHRKCTELEGERDQIQQVLDQTVDNHTAVLETVQLEREQCQAELQGEQEAHAQKTLLLETTQPLHEACQADLTKSKQDHSTCQDRLVESEDVKSTCHQDLATAHEDIATCHGSLASMEADLTTCHQEKHSLRETLSDTKQEHLTAHQTQKDDHKTELRAVKETLHQVRQELQNANHRAKVAEAALAALEVKNEKEEKELDQALRRADEAEQQAQDCQVSAAEASEKNTADQADLSAKLQEQAFRADQAEVTGQVLQETLQDCQDNAEEAAASYKEELARTASVAEQLYMGVEQQLEGCTASAQEAVEQHAQEIKDLSKTHKVETDELHKNAHNEHKKLTAQVNSWKNETQVCLDELMDAQVSEHELQDRLQEATDKVQACMLLLGPEQPTIPEPTHRNNPSPGAAICNLVMFKSVKFPERGIYSDNFDGKLQTIQGDPNPRDFWFYIKPCERDLGNCGDADCVSLESQHYPGYLLRHEHHKIKLVQWEDNDMYHQDVSFCKKPSFSGGGDSQVSFESVNMKKFISSDNDADLKLVHVGDDSDFASKGIASFTVEYLPCNSRRHLLRGDGGGLPLIGWQSDA